MSGTAAADRAAWLEHYNRCEDCLAREPCPVGRERIAAMKATMSPEESLPAWM